MFSFTLKQAEYAISLGSATDFVIGHKKAILNTLIMFQETQAKDCISEILNNTVITGSHYDIYSTDVAQVLYLDCSLMDHQKLKDISKAIINTVLIFGRVAPLEV